MAETKGGCERGPGGCTQRSGVTPAPPDTSGEHTFASRRANYTQREMGHVDLPASDGPFERSTVTTGSCEIIIQDNRSHLLIWHSFEVICISKNSKEYKLILNRKI